MTQQEKPKGLKRIIKAFGYSCDGLKVSMGETAFRQELIVLAVAIPTVFFIDATTAERLLMIGSLFLILIAEMFNTALEYVIERISNDWHEASKKVKDIGSGAVLVAIINALIVWAFILAD